MQSVNIGTLSGVFNLLASLESSSQRSNELDRNKEDWSTLLIFDHDNLSSQCGSQGHIHGLKK